MKTYPDVGAVTRFLCFLYAFFTHAKAFRMYNRDRPFWSFLDMSQEDFNSLSCTGIVCVKQLRGADAS